MQKFNHPFGTAGKKPAAKPMPEQQGEPDGDEGMEDGSEVAAQHGPANMIGIEHDHEGGQHMVHSAHPDGHEHHSQHGSAAEAHDHAKKLAGGEAEEGSMPAKEY